MSNTTFLLNSFDGPNRFAYHGATLRNIRHPCSSPNTSIIKSRCRHKTRMRSANFASAGNTPVSRNSRARLKIHGS